MKLPLYFISDVHLNLNSSANEVKKRKRLIEFFRYVSKMGGTLFIVGDLFDFWFEYKHVMPKAYFDILTALNDAKLNGVDLHFIPGNHDCWGREFLDETLFNKVYPEGVILDIKGKRFLISHGDGLLSWDRGYRVLRSVLRNRVFVFLYRWLHPDIGYAIAKNFSRNDDYDHYSAEQKEKIVEELIQYSEGQCKNDIDYVIIGHYHQHKDIRLENGQFLILGDWIKYHSYGFFDGESLSLKNWENEKVEY